MSIPSDIAMARNPNNGRFNFSWTKADVDFDQTREHEVMSRLVEWRASWWADTNGTHGSEIHNITVLNGSTQSRAEQSARQALADMVSRNDIEIQKVEVTDAPSNSLAGFQLAVFYDVPKSSLPTQKTVVTV